MTVKVQNDPESNIALPPDEVTSGMTVQRSPKFWNGDDAFVGLGGVPALLLLGTVKALIRGVSSIPGWPKRKIV